MPKKDDFDFME